jgi:hypothetical protein
MSRKFPHSVGTFQSTASFSFHLPFNSTGDWTQGPTSFSFPWKWIQILTSQASVCILQTLLLWTEDGGSLKRLGREAK